LLRWRLISAAVILGVLAALLSLDYRRAVFDVTGLWLLPVFIVVGMLATEEAISLLRAKHLGPVAWPAYAGNLLILFAACGPLFFDLAGKPFPEGNPLGRFGWPLAALAIAAVAVLAAEMRRFSAPGTATTSAALGIFALVYVGCLFAFVPMLRLFHDNYWGMLALVSVLWITKWADTGAYFVGRTLGRHKMTPVLSPGKTWEGAAGGVAAACVASWAWFHYFGPWLVPSGYVEPPMWASLAYGLILAVAGMIGDLAESLLKRDAQRKDSSTWLPGLGGVLDIIDSILVASPCAYLCWVFGLVGPGA
jgi:phosphatidate cytidylyltransferase